MRVAIGSDHAGFALKETIKTLLDELEVPYEDFGTTSPVSVDYPDVAETVSRAVVVCAEASARLSRAHNDANIMTLGGRTTPAERAPGIVRAFLFTDYEGGRHGRRLEKIARLERRDA